MKNERLTDDEMVTILEDLARNSGSATARIQAIKLLREMCAGERTTSDAFAALDGAAHTSTRLKAV
jgi:hypothetical protein